jgi:hypothetical protein
MSTVVISQLVWLLADHADAPSEFAGISFAPPANAFRDFWQAPE